MRAGGQKRVKRDTPKSDYVPKQRCSIVVTGCELKCPLCQTLVTSDEMHTCTKPGTKAAGEAIAKTK